MIAKIKQAEEFADIIEVRFDCLQKAELGNLHARIPGSCGPSNKVIDSTNLPIISTFRPKDQGGCRELTWEERRDFWNSGFETEYCDVEEAGFVDDSWSCARGHRILSYHDFSGVPHNLEEIFTQIALTDADIIKIAVQGADITDAIPVWRLLEYAKLYQAKLFNPTRKQQVIPIAMGEAGKWTRILGLAHGAFLTYASLNEGEEVAPGQITATDMIEVYRVKELDLDTKVYGVIGDPVSESLSPYMHNAAFVDQQINSVFLPLQVKDLDEFIHRMVKPDTREVELNFAGFAVTMPHKQTIIKHLDEIDSVAEKIGAVNTVNVRDGKLVGYNTDAFGFITPLLKRFGDVKGASVAVIGAGGAARACVVALKEQKADVTVFARGKKTEQIADEFGVRSEQLTTDQQRLTADIIVNATPLGMKGPLENQSLFTADQLKGVKFVCDLVTGATPLIREAKKAGTPAINGIEMLIYQGAKQFEIWTGKAALLEQMREAIRKKLNRTLK